MDQFELQGFTTPAQRVEKLKELLVRFNMPTDIFDKKRQHDENCLFRCFISNDENPYLKVKAARNTKDALVRSRYMDNPMQIKNELIKEQFWKQEKEREEQEEMEQAKLKEEKRKEEQARIKKDKREAAGAKYNKKVEKTLVNVISSDPNLAKRVQTTAGKTLA